MAAVALPRVEVQIGTRTPVVAGPEWTSLINGGYDAFSGVILDAERTAYPQQYKWGRNVKVRIAATDLQGIAQADANEVIWEGYLLTPAPQEDGTCKLRGRGYHYLLNEREDPMLWQDRYYGHWQDADEEQFGQDFDNNDDIQTEIGKANLCFRIGKGVDLAARDESSLLWWAEDSPDNVLVTRIAGKRKQNRNIDDTAWRLALDSYDAPDAGELGRAQITSIPFASAKDVQPFDTGVLASPAPMVGIRMRRKTNVTGTNVSTRVTIRHLRLNGNAFRNAADYGTDSYTASEMVRDVAQNVGFGGGSIKDTLMNYLPLYWAGGPLSDLMDYLCLSPQGPSLAADITSSQTSITVFDEDVTIPATPFVISIEREQLRVTHRTAGSPATYTVSRGDGSTMAHSHDQGDTVRFPPGTVMVGSYKWGVWQTNVAGEPIMEFRHWEFNNTTWTVAGFGSSAHAIVELSPTEDAYSDVDVAWKRSHSIRFRHARAAISPNPVAGFIPPRTRVYRVKLQDNYHRSALPEGIAQALAAELGQSQYKGRAQLSWATSGGTDKSAFLIRAGHKLTISDHPTGALSLRIYGTRCTETSVELQIGREAATDLSSMLWRREHNLQRKGKMDTNPS